MFKSYRVGTVFGIPFKLDVTFLAILPVFAWILGGQIGEVVPVMNGLFGTAIDPAPLTAGFRPFLIGFAAAVALFACVGLHELGHSVIALRFDYEIESITLWLLGGIAKPVELPRNWVHEFWIAVAGPIVNVVIASLCVGLLAVLPPTDLSVFLLLLLAVLNVSLAAFNMLPAFPLDGGRVLRALLARNSSYVRATRQAAAVGKGFAVVLGIVGVFSFDVILMAIALFVYIAATSESRQMLLDAAFEGVAIEDVMTPAGELATVEVDEPVSALLEFMLDRRHSGYPVFDGDAFVGIVTLSDVQQIEDPDATVSDAMTPRDELATIDPTADVMEAFTLIGRADVGRLPVVQDGELLGIVTRTDLMRAFKIVTAQDRFDASEFRDADERDAEAENCTVRLSDGRN